MKPEDKVIKMYAEALELRFNIQLLDNTNIERKLQDPLSQCSSVVVNKINITANSN